MSSARNVFDDTATLPMLTPVGGACTVSRAFALILLLALSFSSCRAGTSGEKGDPMSAIVIVIDALRRDHLSLYGYPHPTSPFLDHLATESIVFERCLAPSSWTKPSTASLLTGLYLSGHRAGGELEAHESLEFLSEILQERGYATAGFSGNPYVSGRYGMAQGFDHFHFSGGDRAKDYPDIRELLQSVRTWLAGNPATPFFLYLHIMNVHGPYRAPPQYRERFLQLPFEPLPFQGELWNAVRRRERGVTVGRAHLNDLVARYDGAIAYSDEVLGEFLEELRAAGWLRKSVLVVTSDHGEELFDHGNLGHRTTLHGELLDVPLIIRLPDGRGAGRRIAMPVSLIDVPETLLDLLGILDLRPQRRFGDGRSLLPLLEAREPASRSLLAELEGPPGKRGAAVQRWPYRMARMEHDSHATNDVYELYDVAKDPGERQNLATQKRALLEELTLLLDRLRAQAQALGPMGEAVQPDPETKRLLEALGYAE